MWNKKTLWNIWLLNNFKDYIIKKRITWFWFGYNRNNKDHSALIPSSNIEKKNYNTSIPSFVLSLHIASFLGLVRDYSHWFLSIQHRFWFGFSFSFFFFSFFFLSKRLLMWRFLIVLGSIWLLTGGLLAKMGSSCRALLKINPNIKRQNEKNSKF